jgi:hypothetical protein
MLAASTLREEVQRDFSGGFHLLLWLWITHCPQRLSATISWQAFYTCRCDAPWTGLPATSSDEELAVLQELLSAAGSWASSVSQDDDVDEEELAPMTPMASKSSSLVLPCCDPAATSNAGGHGDNGRRPRSVMTVAAPPTCSRPPNGLLSGRVVRGAWSLSVLLFGLR